ncbi:MAG: GTPase ObgE [Acidimicrobiales bacterium]
MSSFVDESGLHVKAGDGGAGCVSMRREAHVSKGGPDGGDGGDGGHVWLVADHNVASLLGFRDFPFRRADNGTHGSGKKQHGKAGESTEVLVPEGTVVKDQDGNVLADLLQQGDRWMAGRGGEGGKGNARFLSNRRRAPTWAEQGEVGEEVWYRLELRLMADVAIIGLPNVGKSTLISRISAAKPKIADYQFTTLEPNLGVVRVDDGFEMVVADIPGLIEGASEGKGLGHQFLRHVERARVLLVMLDLAPYDEMSPDDQLAILLRELGNYQPDLLDRPRLVVGSRCDVAHPDVEFEGLRISAVTGEALPELTRLLGTMVVAARDDEVEPTTTVIHRPVGDAVSVEKLAVDSYRVIGRAAERSIAVNDLTNLDALEYVREKLKAAGVNRALRRAGAREGDTVHIGEMSFEYVEDDA